MSFLEGHNIAPMLKGYRPFMRPYTQERDSGDPAVGAHGGRIVKDWFNYVLWATGLKRVLKKNIHPEFF